MTSMRDAIADDEDEVAYWRDQTLTGKDKVEFERVYAKLRTAKKPPSEKILKAFHQYLVKLKCPHAYIVMGDVRRWV